MIYFTTLNISKAKVVTWAANAADDLPKFLFASRPPMKSIQAEYEVIEHALQHLMWAEQKKFAALLGVSK